MSLSRQEEIICALWVISSLIAFGTGQNVWGWVFAIKGTTDFIITIAYAVMEMRVKNADKASHS